MRAGLYAWVSTDEEATLSLQSNALLAYVAARGWTAICQIEDIGSEAEEHPRRAELMKLARGRCAGCRCGLASGPVGLLAGGPGADVAGTERTGRGVRVAERAVGLDGAVGSGDVRDAGGARGVRAEDPAGASEGGHLTRAPTGAASWSSPDRGASGGGGSSPGVARDESVRDRAAAGDRPDVGAEDLGGEELKSRSVAAGGKPLEADRVFISREAV